MSFADDDEILQDFLLEAGEILEKLSEQLVELEKHPQDKELLNAIFRGFHTVKGGAGFLQIDPMVDCCHKTENLFDLLRNGKREVDAELMDITLQALDAVNVMFSDIQEGRPPQPAAESVLDALAALVSGAQASDIPVPLEINIKPKSSSQEFVEPELAVSEIADDEFAAFVASLEEMPDSSDGTASALPAESINSVSLSKDEISDDEFESLLDALHGKNVAIGAVQAPVASEIKPSAKEVGNNDEISDDEFEALLDQLHHKKQSSAASSVQKGEAPAAGQKAAEEKPIDKVSPDKVSLDKKSVWQKSVEPIVVEKKHIETKKIEQAAATPVAPKIKTKDKAEESDAKSVSVTAENTVRVDTQRLDDIMNMVGELVLVRNRLVRLSGTSESEAIIKAISNLDVVTGDLQNSVMKTRMQPIKKVFGRFPRVVRDLARNLKKEVSLDLVGEETDLDKNLVEALADPLVHLVRNAVDHGIETPDIREKAGKPRQGTVILAAEQEGDHILLTITDDGAGMDANVFRKKAVEKGIMEPEAADRLSDNDCFNLIFAPGFSTKTEISDVSGRGVGMDVVKTKITQLNGMVSIDSTIGKGSKITIKVPLTLAIMPTLMVMLGEQIFAFPLVNVHEIFNLDARKTNIVDGQEVVVVRNKPIPLFYLKRWLVGNTAKKTTSNFHVVVVSVGTQLVGFVVDQLIGQEEVVIKPLGKMLIGTPGIAGATITGDGTMALILDVPTLIKNYASRSMEELAALHEDAA